MKGQLIANKPINPWSTQNIRCALSYLKVLLYSVHPLRYCLLYIYLPMPQNSNMMLEQKSRGYNGMVLRPADLPLNYLNAQPIERYYISAISEMEFNSVQCACLVYIWTWCGNKYTFIYLFIYYCISRVLFWIRNNPFVTCKCPGPEFGSTSLKSGITIHNQQWDTARDCVGIFSSETFLPLINRSSAYVQLFPATLLAINTFSMISYLRLYNIPHSPNRPNVAGNPTPLPTCVSWLFKLKFYITCQLYCLLIPIWRVLDV